jgi:hypothetical protein
MNVNMSFFPFVIVVVGVTPPDHFTGDPHVIPLAVPSAVKIRVNPMERFAVAGVLEMVKVLIGEFRVTPNTCAVLKSTVSTLPVILGVAYGSL